MGATAVTLSNLAHIVCLMGTTAEAATYLQESLDVREWHHLPGRGKVQAALCALVHPVNEVAH